MLVAWRQPEQEQAALGFVEGENVVLYDSEQELEKKLAWLASDSPAAALIPRAGQALVTKQHRWVDRAAVFPELLSAEIQRAPPITWRDRLKILGAGK